MNPERREMSEQNKETALRFMEAMSTNNPELAAVCITSDACAVAKGFGKFAGVRHADTMLGMITEFRKMVPTGLRFTIHTVTSGDDRVVVEAEGDAVTSEGVPYRNQYCFVFTFANGLIRHVNEYFCNIRADEVLWPLVVANVEFHGASQ
jgi:hypothetical protein